MTVWRVVVAAVFLETVEKDEFLFARPFKTQKSDQTTILHVYLDFGQSLTFTTQGDNVRQMVPILLKRQQFERCINGRSDCPILKGIPSMNSARSRLGWIVAEKADHVIAFLRYSLNIKLTAYRNFAILGQ